MKNRLLLIIGLIYASFLFSQNVTQISTTGIKNSKVFEQTLSNGIEQKYIIEETNYDAEGRIIERKVFSRKGNIKQWEKYKFDAFGNLTEELSLDHLGAIIKKEITIFKDQRRLSKEYYDAKNRLYKKKSYEYTYGK